MKGDTIFKPGDNIVLHLLPCDKNLKWFKGPEISNVS